MHHREAPFAITGGRGLPFHEALDPLRCGRWIRRSQGSVLVQGRGRSDVDVVPKQVRWIVPALDLDKPAIVAAPRRANLLVLGLVDVQNFAG